MRSDIFLALCDNHNGIIHQYGSDVSCARTAAVCLRGCSEYEHKQKSSKHEFLHARELYSMVQQIRQSYNTFQKDFREVYLKTYLKNIKTAVQQFEKKMLDRFSSQNAIAQMFGRGNDHNLQFLIQEKQQGIEFAELKCKQVFQLKQFATLLNKGFKSDQEKKSIRILTKQFEDHLRAYKLLPPIVKAIDRNPKNQLIIEANRLADHANLIRQRLQSFQEEPKKINDIVLKLKENLSSYEEDRNFPKQIAAFMSATTQLIKRIVPSQVTLAIKGVIMLGPFWSDFLDLLETENIKNARIITTLKSQQMNVDELRVKAVSQRISLKVEQRDWERYPEVLHENS